MSQIHIGQHRGSFIGTAVAHFVTRFQVLAAEMQNRRQIKKSLGNLSARDLRDIGLIKSDIESATSAPLSQEVATEIKIKARLRSVNW